MGRTVTTRAKTWGPFYVVRVPSRKPTILRLAVTIDDSRIEFSCRVRGARYAAGMGWD